MRHLHKHKVLGVTHRPLAASPALQRILLPRHLPWPSPCSSTCVYVCLSSCGIQKRKKRKGRGKKQQTAAASWFAALFVSAHLSHSSIASSFSMMYLEAAKRLMERVEVVLVLKSFARQKKKESRKMAQCILWCCDRFSAPSRTLLREPREKNKKEGEFVWVWCCFVHFSCCSKPRAQHPRPLLLLLVVFVFVFVGPFASSSLCCCLCHGCG